MTDKIPKLTFDPFDEDILDEEELNSILEDYE